MLNFIKNRSKFKKVHYKLAGKNLLKKTDLTFKFKQFGRT